MKLRIYLFGDLKSDWYPKNAIQMFEYDVDIEVLSVRG